MDNCRYYCVNSILFLENYVQGKEVIYFCLECAGGVCNKMEGGGGEEGGGGSGLTFNEKFINWGDVINRNG